MKSRSVKTKTLLSIEDLSVTLYTDKVTVCPVNKVNYSVESGKVLAIVGESGSGKTVMNMAPLGLLPQGVTVDIEGSVKFEGKNLLAMKEQEKQKIYILSSWFLLFFLFTVAARPRHNTSTKFFKRLSMVF